MKHIVPAIFASTSLLAVASTAAAQPADRQSPDPATQAQVVDEANEETGSEEIVVTARRRAESLQDVPQTVNVVGGDDVAELNIQDFAEIQSIVPGLTLESSANGFSTAASVRGATFNIESGAGPTVAFYLNEVPVESNIIFSSMFDVGQIEVLRGPQGTLRGRSAPSGAITITNRRPDVSEIGGFLNITGTSHGGINVQAAAGLPIIQDMLAIRIAGVIDHNDFNGVESVNSPVNPSSETQGVRASLRFEPTSNLSATLMYQYLNRDVRSFTQVTGTGAPGGIVPAYTFGPFTYPSRPAPPAGYNGPPIAPGDRLAVEEDPRNVNSKFQVLTGNIDWRFAGQRLSYVGGWSKQDVFALNPADPFNSFPGSFTGTLNNKQTVMTHELRLASDERIAGLFDYTIGGFYSKSNTDVFVIQSQFFPGAFGPIPANPNVPQPLVAPDRTFVAPVIISLEGKAREISLFATLTAHVGERTELTGGVRRINYKDTPGGPFFISNATTPPATVIGLGSTICVGAARFRAPPGPPLFGFSIPTGVTCILNASDTTPTKEKAWVWNLSASHKFSDDLMVYVTSGTSWRPGPFTVVPFDLVFPGFASSNDLRLHDPETSRSIELGFKASFFDKRGRLNVAVYQQKFKDYFFFTNSTYSLRFSGGAPSSVGTFNFTANADAKVRGIDVDAAFQITPNWDISGAFSWAKGQVDDDLVPCNDSNFDGVPDLGVPTVAGFVAAGVIVARCRSNDSISRSPRWNVSLRSEYSHPISSNVDGFLRAQFTYYPDNPFRNQGVVIDNYGILNVFAGIRSPNNAWELNVFAKNALKASQVTSLELAQNIHQVYGNTGYSTVDFTPRREFGVNLRYAFGSR